MRRTAFLILGLSCPLSAAEFQGLGDFPGGEFRSRATNASPDGQLIAGSGSPLGGFGTTPQAFIWTSDTGLESLGIPPGFDDNAGVRTSVAAIAEDGVTLYVGASQFVDDQGYINSRIFRWTRDFGYTLVEPQVENFAIRDVSADGKLLAGFVYEPIEEWPYGITSEGAIWNIDTGDVRRLGTVIQGKIHGTGATSMSADGSVIVGNTRRSVVFDGEELYLPMWISRNGGPFAEMPRLDDAEQIRAAAITDDGRTIVGTAFFRLPSGGRLSEPFVWQTDTGYVRLGMNDQTRYGLPDGQTKTGLRIAQDASSDASIIIGYQSCTTCLGDSWSEAFVWDAWHGTRSLQQVLTHEFGLGGDLQGWRLENAFGISADGSTIVGEGRNPQGQQEAWRAEISQLAPTNPLPGDANLDGVANISDFVILKQHFGRGAFWYQGNFDGLGVVGLADFEILRSSLGSGSSNVVPEPSSILMAVFGGATCLVLRQLRRSSFSRS